MALASREDEKRDLQAELTLVQEQISSAILAARTAAHASLGGDTRGVPQEWKHFDSLPITGRPSSGVSLVSTASGSTVDFEELRLEEPGRFITVHMRVLLSE